MNTDIRYMNSNDDPLKISNVYEQSWKTAYKDIIPQSYLNSNLLESGLIA